MSERQIDFLGTVEHHANDPFGWKTWYFVNKSLSNIMFIIVIAGGMVSSISAAASDQVKGFVDPKIVGGVAGALVVAAKLRQLKKQLPKYIQQLLIYFPHRGNVSTNATKQLGTLL